MGAASAAGAAAAVASLDQIDREELLLSHQRFNPYRYKRENDRQSEIEINSPRLDSYRQKQREEDLQLEKEYDRMREEMDRTKRQFASQCLPFLSRKSIVGAYTHWLEGYMDNGGEPTHCYDYCIPDSFYVATHNFNLMALYGAGSISIVVPKGIKVTYDNLGHNEIYEVDGFVNYGGCIPIYNDIRI